MVETCYACNEPGPTREHVPPRSLFPEGKDLPEGEHYRKDLFTVPSCEKHNSSKSIEDEYLLAILCVNLPANHVARRQVLTKVSRAIKRNPRLRAQLLDGAIETTVKESHSGRRHEVFAQDLRVEFIHSLRAIARALYRHAFASSWLDAIELHADYVDFHFDDPKKAAQVQRDRLLAYACAEEIFKDCERIGSNPDVFWYQVIEPEEPEFRCILRLCFYGACTAVAMFRADAAQQALAAGDAPRCR